MRNLARAQQGMLCNPAGCSMCGGPSSHDPLYRDETDTAGSGMDKHFLHCPEPCLNKAAVCCDPHDRQRDGLVKGKCRRDAAVHENEKDARLCQRTLR